MTFDEWSDQQEIQDSFSETYGHESAAHDYAEEAWRAAIQEAIRIVNSTSVLNGDKRDRFPTVVAELEAILP